MRVLLRFILLAFLAVLLWPQDPVQETAQEPVEAIDQEGEFSTLSATLPIDERDLPQGLLKQWGAATDGIKENNPTAVENRARRGKGVVHFDIEEDADGEPGAPDDPPPPVPPGKRKRALAVFGSDLTYKDGATGEWRLLEPTFWTSQRGWVQTGTPVDVVIYHRTGNQSYAIQHHLDPDTGERHWLGMAFPRLTHVQDAEFSYQHNKHAWRLFAATYGFSFASEPVAGRRGALTFNFPFEASHPLRADEDGNIVSDASPMRLIRAAMKGANGESYYCGPWTVSASTLSFVCNDSTLPNDALPYSIDPVSSFMPLAYTDEINVDRPGWGTKVRHGGNCEWGQCGVFAMGNEWDRYDREMFFRWDTSSLPDNATITAAHVSIIMSQGRNTHTFMLHWYPASRWPITTNVGYHGDAANSVFAGSLTRAAAAANERVIFPLTDNLGQIDKAGYTGLRFEAYGYPWTTKTFTDFLVSGYIPGSVPRPPGDPAVAPLLVVDYWANEPPYRVSVTGVPDQVRYGEWVNVAARVGDPQGHATINYWQVLINNLVNGVNACNTLLVNRGNYLHLMNDAGTDWGSAYAMGSANVIGNSMCEIDVVNSSFSYPSDTDVIAHIRLRFKPLAIPRNPMRFFLYVLDLDGASSGPSGAFHTATVRTQPALIVTQY